jgi:hypothetical protein
LSEAALDLSTLVTASNETVPDLSVVGRFFPPPYAPS